MCWIFELAHFLNSQRTFFVACPPKEKDSNKDKARARDKKNTIADIGHPITAPGRPSCQGVGGGRPAGGGAPMMPPGWPRAPGTATASSSASHSPVRLMATGGATQFDPHPRRWALLAGDPRGKGRFGSPPPMASRDPRRRWVALGPARTSFCELGGGTGVGMGGGDCHSGGGGRGRPLGVGQPRQHHVRRLGLLYGGRESGGDPAIPWGLNRTEGVGRKVQRVGPAPLPSLGTLGGRGSQFFQGQRHPSCVQNKMLIILITVC